MQQTFQSSPGRTCLPFCTIFEIWVEMQSGRFEPTLRMLSESQPIDLPTGNLQYRFFHRPTTDHLLLTLPGLHFPFSCQGFFFCFKTMSVNQSPWTITKSIFLFICIIMEMKPSSRVIRRTRVIGFFLLGSQDIEEITHSSPINKKGLTSECQSVLL